MWQVFNISTRQTSTLSFLFVWFFLSLWVILKYFSTYMLPCLKLKRVLFFIFISCHFCGKSWRTNDYETAENIFNLTILSLLWLLFGNVDWTCLLFEFSFGNSCVVVSKNLLIFFEFIDRVHGQKCFETWNLKNFLDLHYHCKIQV